MKFVNDATAKDTAFIKCFPDDSGVYARVLTETELDTLRVKSRTFNGNEKRTPELVIAASRSCTCNAPSPAGKGWNSRTARPSPFPRR